MQGGKAPASTGKEVAKPNVKTRSKAVASTLELSYSTFYVPYIIQFTWWPSYLASLFHTMANLPQGGHIVNQDFAQHYLGATRDPRKDWRRIPSVCEQRLSIISWYLTFSLCSGAIIALNSLRKLMPIYRMILDRWAAAKSHGPWGYACKTPFPSPHEMKRLSNLQLFPRIDTIILT